jgi:hypothetical protein
MIVKFELNGHECEADVRAVGTPDECSKIGAPDEAYEIRWIQDSGAPQRDLDNAAVSAFLEEVALAERAERVCPFWEMSPSERAAKYKFETDLICKCRTRFPSNTGMRNCVACGKFFREETRALKTRAIELPVSSPEATSATKETTA